MTEQQATFYGKMFQDLNLTELEIEEDGARLCLKKTPEDYQNLQNQLVKLITDFNENRHDTEKGQSNNTSDQQDNLIKGNTAAVRSNSAETTIKAPLLGIFHRAPSPTESPFVEEGDVIKKGDVLCVIEAMKMMNEITAGKDGTIVAICAEENSIVEYGQVIFEIM